MTRQIWWKDAVIYQIYPRSFRDSNGDGIGDIRGIIEKVDYLADLGIDVVWLGPVYQSPNDDNGYDISDYRSIHPDFGTLADLDQLLHLLHLREIRLIMDLVVNHTSDEHDWFQESRKSLDNPYRDYYFWKKGQNGAPPNNWKSFFGGSAWAYEEDTDEYYLHLFTKKQPDLNWENPVVRNEVCDIIRFWLERGVDGFRMDVIPLISKRLDFKDTQLNSFPEVVEQVYSNGPKVHKYIGEIVGRVISNYDVMTVGEGPGIHTEVGLDYVGTDRGELNMIFHLDHMYLGFGPKGRFDPIPFSLNDVFEIFNRWDDAMANEGWISIFLDNHDFTRMLSRFGNDQNYRIESAKLLVTLIMTLRGTPCIYQGSEIGMTNIAYERLEDFDDVESKNFIREALEKGREPSEILELVNRHGRDNARTPMQWDDSMHAGFTSGHPWLTINPNYRRINVEESKNDANGILHFYKKMIAFRKEHPVFVYGDFTCLFAADPIYMYSRSDDQQSFVVVHNFGDHRIDMPEIPKGYGYHFSSYPNDQARKLLAPWESRIFIKS